MCYRCVLSCALLMLFLGSVSAQPKWTHGKRALMLEPPQRSSLWRFGNETPLNINDSALNCGGFERQWERNNGACGVCGDPADGPQLHDEGGVYDSNIIVKTYIEGGYVNITVEVESNMLGYFEFRLCERNSSDAPLTQECFDKNLLWIEESWNFRYYVGSHGGLFDLHVRLSENVVCSHCVLQWKYSTGHRMGGINNCAEMGSGRQEQFYNCADVAIVKKQSDTMFERPLLSLHENIYIVPHELTYNLTRDELEILKEEIRKISPGMKQTIPNGFLEPLEFNFTFPMPIDQMFGKPPTELNQPPFWWLDNMTKMEPPHVHIHDHPSKEPKTPPPVKAVQTRPPPDILRTAPLPPPPAIELTLEDGINESRIKVTRDRTNDKDRVATPRKSPMYAVGDSFVFPVFKRNLVRKPATVAPSTTVKPLVSSTAEECTVFSPKFRCVGKGQYNETEGIVQWCIDHCEKDSCVDFMCECGCNLPIAEPKCRANGVFQMMPSMNEWCTRVCQPGGLCPANVCNVELCMPNSTVPITR